MFDLSQKGWRSGQGKWASLAVLACLVGGVGCAEMDDETESWVETQEQSLEVQQASAGESAASRDLGEGADGDAYEKGTLGMALDVARVSGEQIMSVSWRANQVGEVFKLCWKKTSESGTVCSHNEIPITVGGPDYDGIRQSAQFPTECGTEYKVRVKSFLKLKTDTEVSTACDPVKACPYGGWYDDANCQIGQAPAGTNAFIFDGAYYYTYSSGATKCPLPGSYDDSESCFVQWISSNVHPFIHNNH